MVIFLLGMAVTVSSCSRNYSKEEIDKKFAPITSKYGIEIRYHVDEKFPPMMVTGQRAKIDKLVPIRHSVLVRYPSILQKALQKYPEHVIRDSIDAICFASVFENKGITFSGTYGYFDWAVYLIDDGWKNDAFAENTFHHEFSSILLSQKGFYINPWTEHNPKDFKYLYETAKNNYDVKTTGKGTISDYNDGFITDYGRTTFENDFNEYSAMIFTNPKEFKKIMDQYSRVRSKFKIWLDFYQKIDPVFTEAYFFGDAPFKRAAKQ